MNRRIVPPGGMGLKPYAQLLLFKLVEDQHQDDFVWLYKAQEWARERHISLEKLCAKGQHSCVYDKRGEFVEYLRTIGVPFKKIGIVMDRSMQTLNMMVWRTHERRKRSDSSNSTAQEK